MVVHKLSKIVASVFFGFIPFWMISDGSRLLYLFVVTIGD